MHFRSAYQDEYVPKENSKCPGETLTLQAHAEECDVNRIMARWEKTGQLPDNGHREPQFGDVSEVPDLQSAQNIFIEAQACFGALDARVRARFGNSPVALYEWLADPENLEEAAKLGLFKPEAVQRVNDEKNAIKTPGEGEGKGEPSKKGKEAGKADKASR